MGKEKTQKCRECKKSYLLSEDYFHKKSSSKSGFRNICKACRKLNSREYYKKNKNSINEKNARNREQKISSDPLFYQKERSRAKKYRQKNSKKILKYNKKYFNKRIKNDKAFALRVRLNKSINKYLNNGKYSSIWKSISYTPEELKDHLESKFESEMNWDNYGKYWVIDHIIPQAALPFSSLDDPNFKKCWNLMNLRPMVKDHNLSKSSVFLGIRHNKYSKQDASRFILKPWGAELIWTQTSNYVGKILLVTKGSRLSLQYHNSKEETMFVKSGIIKIYHGLDTESLSETIVCENDSFHIPPKTLHRVEAIVDSEIFEVSTTELDDVVRIQDDYKRS